MTETRRRCYMCDVNWPDRKVFSKCPLCAGNSTWEYGPAIHPGIAADMIQDHANANHKRELFEAYYVEHAAARFYAELESWWAGQLC